MKLSSYLWMHAAACAGPHAHTYNNQKLKIKKHPWETPQVCSFYHLEIPGITRAPGWRLFLRKLVGSLGGVVPIIRGKTAAKEPKRDAFPRETLKRGCG